MSDTADQEIIDAYLSGDTLAVIAERFGGSHVTWWRMLRRHGVTMRPRGTGSAETRRRRADVLALYGEGVPQAEIARRLSARQQVVWGIVNDARSVSR